MNPLTKFRWPLALAALALMIGAPASRMAGAQRPGSEPAPANRQPLIVPLSPEQKAVFAFEPPLGLADAARLSAELRRQLETAIGETPPNEKRLASCRLALEGIMIYLAEEAGRGPGLHAYEWTLASRERVAPGEPLRVERLLLKPLEGPGALAFHAVGGRALVEDVEGIGADGERFPATPRTVYLRKEAPGREVCHFHAPPALASFSAAIATDEPTGSTVEIWAGRPPEPEHGKLALHWLRRANLALREYRFAQAIEELKLAERRLLLFRRVRAEAQEL